MRDHTGAQCVELPPRPVTALCTVTPGTHTPQHALHKTCTHATPHAHITPCVHATPHTHHTHMPCAHSTPHAIPHAHTMCTHVTPHTCAIMHMSGHMHMPHHTHIPQVHTLHMSHHMHVPHHTHIPRIHTPHHMHMPHHVSNADSVQDSQPGRPSLPDPEAVASPHGPSSPEGGAPATRHPCPAPRLSSSPQQPRTRLPLQPGHVERRPVGRALSPISRAQGPRPWALTADLRGGQGMALRGMLVSGHCTPRPTLTALSLHPSFSLVVGGGGCFLETLTGRPVERVGLEAHGPGLRRPRGGGQR